MNLRTDVVDQPALSAAIAATVEHDGARPLSEQAELAISHPRDGVRHLFTEDHHAYLQVDSTDPDHHLIEGFVVPAARRAGHALTLAEQVLPGLTDRPVLAWAHGDHPAAASLARRLGAQRVRELFQLVLPLPLAQLFPVNLPDGVRIDAFRPGIDDDAWLAVNAAAFAHHPEQGRWTAVDLAPRLASDWFDPDGFLLAWRGTELVGFHWTKVGQDPDGSPTGEVYVVGVAPSEQGSGLGKALTGAGLNHLNAVRPALARVRLYVDGDNTAARKLYARLGFTPDVVDVQYRIDPQQT